MYNRRRGRTSSPPTPAALIAATAVYRPNPSSPDPHLAAAAAGAALRHVTVTPTPPGTIQTKRMLQRRESYSSVTPPSGDENGRVQRSHSTSSLTGRRFRKPKPLPPHSLPVQQQQYYQPAGAANARSRSKRNARGYFPSSSSDNGDSEEDSHVRRSASVRSTSSNLSFPSTLRGPVAPDRKFSKPKHASLTGSMLSRGSLRGPKPVSPPYPDRLPRRLPEPDLTAQNRRKNQRANGNVCQTEYSESVCSTTGSDLGSIAEEGGRAAGRTFRNNAPPTGRMAEEGIEGQDETFNFRRRDKTGATRRPSNKVHETSSIPRAVTQTMSTSPTRKRNPILSLPSNSPERAQGHHREQSLSPSRTHFSLNAAEETSTKHSPPPRSVSPAKSALKHRPASPLPVPSVPANAHLDNSPSLPSGRKARVIFSDEDSVASSIHCCAPISTDSAAPPTLPVFGSTRRTGRDALQNGNGKDTTTKSPTPAIYSISLPPSSSSQEDLRPEQQRTNMVDSPDGRLEHTPPETNPSNGVLGKPVPNLVVAIPTLREERDENETTSPAVRVPGGSQAGGSSSNAAAQAREGSDNDSDGTSIYSDAFEDLEESSLPSIMQVTGSQQAPHTQPQLNTTNPPALQNDTQSPRTKSTKPHQGESPTLPPDLTPAPTISPSPSCGPQASTQTHSTSPSSDTASITPTSSFKRAHPRQPRTSMRTTMRSDPPPSAPSRPHQKSKQKSTLRATSRIPDSSDDGEDEYQWPAFQSRLADSDDEDFAIGAVSGAGIGGKAKLRKRPNSSTFFRKEKDNVGKAKGGFWSRFGKKEKKDGLKGKEPAVAGSESERTAPAVMVVTAPAVVPDATTVDSVAKPLAGSGATTKQKPRAIPEAKISSVRTKGPSPSAKGKKGWRRLFSNV
ncbi:unnamed protein product [Tuber aestivum]|uniref:Uncharacterized protein n=1 Tax=Tuber aestivum TaxID=59557 RepID=A0A292PK10_9PEZI|nr:unnamed protein product [Tuber aestivum]